MWVCWVRRAAGQGRFSATYECLEEKIAVSRGRSSVRILGT